MRKKLIVGLATCLLLGGGASFALAATDGGPDGGGGAVFTEACGAEQVNIVRTSAAPSVTSLTNFAALPPSWWNFNVPAGQSRCVKLLFTAETSCTGYAAGSDYCYVQATIDGLPMDPNGGGFQAMDSEDATAAAHAFEWVQRVGPGNHTIQIEQRVGNNATVFRTDDWTEDIQIKG